MMNERNYQPPQQQPQRKSRKLLWIIVGALVLCMGGCAAIVGVGIIAVVQDGPESSSPSSASADEGPIPAGKKAYVGEWKAPGVTLTITADGGVRYERVTGSNSKKVNAPITKFEGDNFVVGVLFVDTTFKVERPPHREGKRWKMVVDGVELSREASDGESSSAGAPSAGMQIKNMHMALDDGREERGEVASIGSFKTTDKTIYCVIDLEDAQPGDKLNVVWTAVDAGPDKNVEIGSEETILDDSGHNRLFSQFSAKSTWLPGRYKVEVQADGKALRSVDFEVR